MNFTQITLLLLCELIDRWIDYGAEQR